MSDDITLPRRSEDKVILFEVISRFEFALKESGYILGGCGDRAQPDWDGFAKTIDWKKLLAKLIEDPDVSEFCQHPPAEQVVVCVENGKKSWTWKSKGRPDKSVAALLGDVRRVRNNLFHGGKEGECPRDEQLCRAAHKILMACLTMNKNVGDYFQGYY